MYMWLRAADVILSPDTVGFKLRMSSYTTNLAVAYRSRVSSAHHNIIFKGEGITGGGSIWDTGGGGRCTGSISFRMG